MSNLHLENLLFAQIRILGWELSPTLIAIIALAALLKLKHWASKRPQDITSFNERSERKKIALPLMISTPITHEFSIKTYDVSLSGAFLSYTDLLHSMSFTSLIGKRTGIKCGDLIDVKILISRFSHITCQARVVRYDLDPNGPHSGIGLEFVNIGRRQRSLLAKIIYSQDTVKAS